MSDPYWPSGSRIDATTGLACGPIELDRNPDPDGGRYFRFLLNGRPLLARGAAWLTGRHPVDGLPEQNCRQLVGTARDAT